jgi:hypothetical protein
MGPVWWLTIFSFSFLSSLSFCVINFCSALNGVGLWFSQGLLGVRALDYNATADVAGYYQFVLNPAIGVGGLQVASGSVATMHGTVQVSETRRQKRSNGREQQKHRLFTTSK